MPTRIALLITALLGGLHLAAETVTLPFQMVGQLIVLEATVNGRTGNYILDTGAPSLVLNARYHDGRPTTRTYHGVLGTAGRVKATYVKISSETFTSKFVYADVLPLSHLERSRGMAIHGLIGCNVFRRSVLHINYASKTLTIVKDRDLKLADEMAPAKRVVATWPLRYVDKIPYIQWPVGNKMRKLVLDTAAEINILDQSLYQELIHSNHVIGQTNICGTGKQIGEGKVNLLWRPAQLPAVMDESIAMKTSFLDLQAFNAGIRGPSLDGIVGSELLTRYEVIINFSQDWVKVLDRQSL